jgi:hypothetical protein
LFPLHAGAYFTYLLIMFMISLAMSALFRFIGAIAATPVHAQAFGSLGLLTLILTSGFAIIRSERSCASAASSSCDHVNHAMPASSSAVLVLFWKSCVRCVWMIAFLLLTVCFA